MLLIRQKRVSKRMPLGTCISTAYGLPINPALKASVLSPHYSGAQSWEKSVCPQLTPASSTHFWLSVHGTFPEGIQNKFFVMVFQKLHCWAERKFMF